MEVQANYIRRIEIHGLWHRYDIAWELRPDVNILSGINGVGKTTILNRSVGYLEQTTGEVKSDEKNGVHVFFDNPEATFIPYDVIRSYDRPLIMGDFTARMAKTYGGRIAVGVDARDGYVAVSGWKELSAERGVDFCHRLRDAGVKTVIYTDISRDGAEQGTNLDLYRELAKIDGLDITASGGVSSIQELQELQQIGTKAAILGKALYTGRLDLKTVIEEVGVC